MTHKEQLPTLLLKKATKFTGTCQHIDHTHKALGHNIPSIESKTQLTSAFWSLIDGIEIYNQQGRSREIQAMAEACRTIVGPWLFRSPYFWRSYYKPHGYAGDFRIIEWTYDLENNPCDDPSEPGIVNCLNYLFKTFPCVQNVWDRRNWLYQLLKAELSRTHGRLRVLDIACGGARYIRDFLSGTPDVSNIHVVLVDQDAASLAFCQREALRPWLDRITMVQTPITSFPKAIPAGSFDVVISAGLFDYLGDRVAKNLIEQMVYLTAPGGVVGITNFHPKDLTRLVREWLVDWWVISRDEKEVANLFSDPHLVELRQSQNNGLVFAARRMQ